MDNNYMVSIPAETLQEMLKELEVLKLTQSKIRDEAPDDRGIEYLTGLSKSKIDNIGNYLSEELNKQMPKNEELSSMFK